MDPHSLEELARTITKEREEEARRTLRRAQARPEPGEPLRSRLARALFRLALRLDATVNGGMTSAPALNDQRKSSRV